MYQMDEFEYLHLLKWERFVTCMKGEGEDS